MNKNTQLDCGIGRTRPSILLFKPKSKGRPLFGLSTLRRAETSTEKEILRFFL
jgi:hypothetical protein